MKVPLWNTKGPRSKVKSPINKEEITFTCCQGPALQKDWCSHIKSAPWKVLLKLYECQLYRWFFTLPLLCFTLRACSVVLSGYWYWDFCLVCWFGHLKKQHAFLIFSSKYFPPFLFCFLFRPYSHRVCCSLFVACTIIQKCGAFFWQPLKQANEKWLTQFSSSSFSLCLIIMKRMLTDTYTWTSWCTFSHIPSQMISEDSSAKRHLNQWSSERVFVNVQPLWHTVHLEDIDASESDGPWRSLISCHL